MTTHSHLRQLTVPDVFGGIPKAAGPPMFGAGSTRFTATSHASLPPCKGVRGGTAKAARLPLQSLAASIIAASQLALPASGPRPRVAAAVGVSGPPLSSVYKRFSLVVVASRARQK